MSKRPSARPSAPPDGYVTWPSYQPTGIVPAKALEQRCRDNMQKDHPDAPHWRDDPSYSWAKNK